MRKSDKGVPVVAHGNSVVQRNALKICWNPVMQSQTKKFFRSASQALAKNQHFPQLI